MTRFALLFASILFTCACTQAQTQPSPAGGTPAARAEASLPHDSHAGLSLSADAYTENPRAKEKFGKANPLPAGILPVEVFLRNETNQLIHIDLSTIELDVHPTGSKQENINRLSVQDVASAIAYPAGAGTPKTSRFPIGLPSGGDSKVDKLTDILRPLTLDADIVPPMGAIHGFLFFDMNHDFFLTEHTSLYVPDVTILPSNKTLIFFEVPLAKDLNR